MTAKQTMSASLVGLLCAVSPVLAEEPEPDADVQPPGEVQPRPKLELMPKRAPTGTFELGAGYATDDGFLATARVAQPRLFGTDKGLSLSALVSERRQEFLTRYEDPTLFDVLHLRGDLYSRRKLYPGFQRQAAGGMLTLGRRIAPNLDVFVGYRLEQVEVTPDATTLARGVRAEPFWRGGMIGAVRTGVHYSTLERDRYPARGTDVGAAIEVADRGLGSDLDYLRTDAWLGHHRPLGPFTLHLGARASSITDVPLSERLHFDGSSEVRGYAPGAVGPTDPITGLPTGGNFLWSARGELEAPLGDTNLSLVGFVDAGGLYAPWGGQTAASAGFGVIWRSPIGPLRFDVAYPLDGDGKPRYIFGIGGMF